MPLEITLDTDQVFNSTFMLLLQRDQVLTKTMDAYVETVNLGIPDVITKTPTKFSYEKVIC